jgi:hypothetical protein
MKRDKYTLNDYIKEHHPLIWEKWEKFQIERKREKARIGMRAKYVPTGNTPGRPRIEETKSPAQPVHS